MEGEVFPLNYVTIEPPPGWTCRHDGPTAVVLAHIQFQDRPLDEIEIGLRVEIVRSDLNAAEFSEHAMARHVRQGSPVRADASVGGVRGIQYRWTDGVRFFDTWFGVVVRGDVVRVDCWRSGNFVNAIAAGERWAQLANIDAHRLFDAVAWSQHGSN